MSNDNIKLMGLQPRTGMDRSEAMKRYDEPYTTPYYDELKKHGIRLPCFLTHIRTDECRRIKPTDARMFRMMFTPPRIDGCCGTLDTRPISNLIMTKTDTNMELTYHEHPTKEQLLEYFSQRIRVRKMTPREAFRLMDVSDEDIEKIQAYPFKSFAERQDALKDAGKKNRTKIKRDSICKTAQYKLAGNSIVVSCLYHIFRTMFIPGRPENEKQMQVRQMTIFDYL